jgi:hypothetical protein
MALARTEVEEEWRAVTGTPLEASSYGRVRRSGSARVLSPHVTSRGYEAVEWIDERGKRHQPMVHRLVAAAFLGPCPPRREVNHIDGVKTHNALPNLEYVTHQENVQHAVRTGLIPSRPPRERPPLPRRAMRKLTDADVLSMRRRFASGAATMAELAGEYGVREWNAYKAVHGINFKHLPEAVAPRRHGGSISPITAAS